MFRARDRDGLGDEALGAAQLGIASILLTRLAQELLRQGFERDCPFGRAERFARRVFGFAALVAFGDPRLRPGRSWRFRRNRSAARHSKSIHKSPASGS